MTDIIQGNVKKGEEVIYNGLDACASRLCTPKMECRATYKYSCQRTPFLEWVTVYAIVS